jgi:hypothetical protein
MPPREPRSQAEMVEALRKHVRLLEEYAQKYFGEGLEDYGGEVAGKLRLLVGQSKSNQALLLRLMKETGAEIKLVLGGPPIPNLPVGQRPGDEVTLEELLNMHAAMVRVPSGDLVSKTKLEIIRMWADQAGAPHEDWSMDPALRHMLENSYPLPFLNAILQPLKQEVATTTKAVLQVARCFLQMVDAGEVSIRPS